MQVIGLTGGIAAGKSTVLQMLRALGAQVRSADEDARAVLAPGSPAMDKVLAAFPDARTDSGVLDRARLAARIFADPPARRQLEQITHPAIIARIRSGIAKARAQESGVLVYEVPLLFEARLAPLFDTTIAVITEPAVQRRRLRERQAAAGLPDLTDAEMDQRIRAQWSAKEKAAHADFVIVNDGDFALTQQQVEALWDQLVRKASV